MVFSSSLFLFIFLPFVFIINITMPRRYRNVFLLLASLIFYAWGEPVFILIMLASIIVNHLFGQLILKYTNANTDNNTSISTSTKKLYLVLCIIANILLLIVFKYADFIIENINLLFSLNIPAPNIPLPIGISFFTFQAMSYIVDLYRDNSYTNNRPSLLNTALYISFFPQLIAGPIVKYHEIAQQIEKREISIEKVSSGIQRFIIGLSKKILIANVMGEVADTVFSFESNSLNILIAWIGALTYSLQIYFDFSGYSDMAIGLAKMFGFEINENFNYPYIATSIKDFWRRWHISLTTWFREYLYIPLGGNRISKTRTYINISVVFLCTGIWHGAEWTFILWGIFHGIFMLFENSGIIKPERFKLRLLGHIYTLLVVVVGFTIFRAESIRQAKAFLTAMFSGIRFNQVLTIKAQLLISPLVLLTFIIAVIAATPIIKLINKAILSSVYTEHVRKLGYALTLILLILCILSLSSATYNPFIYFRF